MPRPDQLAALATGVRRVYEDLSRVTNRVELHGLPQLASELCDVELELLRAHQKLLQLALKSSPTPSRHQVGEAHDDFPF